MKYEFLIIIYISARVLWQRQQPREKLKPTQQQQQQNKRIISHLRALFRPAILRLVYPFY
jgi:hypothetical protein